jgi:hypothetical protein
VSARRCAAMALALLATLGVARADIVLDGHFHVGDEDTRTEFTPLDPVDCDKYRSFPTRFHLTEGATITGFRLHDAIDLDNATFTVDIDGVQRTALSCLACDLCDGTSSCGSVTVTLAASVALGAGDHTVAVVDPSGSSGNCNTGNDFGWSKLTLLSTAGTTSIMLARRRHIGDSADTDDDYDATDTANPFYPDAFEGDPITQSFTLSEGRRLTEVRLYRLRDLDTSTSVVQVNGTTLGALANTGDPLEADPTTVATSLLLAAGTHSVTVNAGDLGVGSIDDFSWDSIQLRFASTTASGTPGFFNAVDVGDAVLTGSIVTKVAGAPFTLDLYALNGFGTGQNLAYAGLATVEVLDATDNSGTIDVYGCNSEWEPAQTLSTTTLFVGGYAEVSGTFLDAGLKDARIRVTDAVTGARGCSIDNFAIRPANFLVEPSHDSEVLAGVTVALTNTAASGLPRHRAGQEFTIRATARSATGATVTAYDGTPDVSVAALAPATVNGLLTIESWGLTGNGIARTDTARYFEAGPVTLTLTDSSWAGVDAGEIDAEVAFTGAAGAGRFVPDHFNVTEGSLTPACAAGGFSYLGDVLTWATPAAQLTAAAANNQPTLNYEGTLETLPATLGQPTYAALAGTLDTAGLAAPTISAAVDGVANVTLPDLSFVRSLTGVFDAEIRIELPAIADDDGTVPAESPIVLGALTAGGGVAFTGNAKSQRFGRLYFEPRYGSERLPLDVPLRAEYFDGVTFRHNTADACTSLATADVTFTGIGGQTHAVTANGSGRWTVTLSAPNAPGQATLSVDLASPPVTPAVNYPLLQADADGDGTYAEDPAGAATFGIYSQEQRWIYQREVVGN